MISVRAEATSTRRLSAAVLCVVLLAACTGRSGASSTTTAPSTTTTPSASTPLPPADGTGATTTTTSTLPGNAAEPDQDIFTRVPGVLTVATESLAPPWYIGTTPATVSSGFEYDVAKALAARLRVPAVHVVIEPLVTVLSGEDCACDLMLSQVLVTDNRARTADLTEPYLTVDQAVLVRQGDTMPSVDAGRAFRWGVALSNAAGLDVIKHRIKPVTPPTVLVDQSDGVRQLIDGRLDAMIVHTPDALAIAAANPTLSVTGQLRTGELYAGALDLGSPTTSALNDAIRDMRDDGTIAFFLRLYFGMNPADVPEIPS